MVCSVTISLQMLCVCINSQVQFAVTDRLRIVENIFARPLVLVDMWLMSYLLSLHVAIDSILIQLLHAVGKH